MGVGVGYLLAFRDEIMKRSVGTFAIWTILAYSEKARIDRSIFENSNSPIPIYC